MIRRFTPQSVYLELRSDLLNIDQKKNKKNNSVADKQVNSNKREIKDEDKMDFIDPAKGIHTNNDHKRLLCMLVIKFLSSLYRHIRDQSSQCSVRFPIFEQDRSLQAVCFEM